MGSADPNLLSDIKSRVRGAQCRAVLAVNAELLQLYWDIGRQIDLRQKEVGWGAGVIPRLALDLHNALPETKGFSERNVKRMLAFYRAYPDPSALSLPGTEPAEGPLPAAPNAPPSAASMLWQIGWSQHALLLEKVKDLPTRRWYIHRIVSEGWGRDALGAMIRSAAHTGEVIAERIGYMMDPGQGSDGGGRSPWLHAADHACPSFDRSPGSTFSAPGALRQLRQAQDFVEKVLKPKN